MDDPTTTQTVSDAVARLYNTYPFPPEPILDQAPPGYNWRWYWPTVHSFCTGAAPASGAVRVLDAGCGTGVSTEYIAHLNPQAEVLGIDLSDRAIATATQRCQSSGATNVRFRQLSIYDVDQLEGDFDWINCVGVIHHMPDPLRGLQALATKLAPGGFIHLFVYAAIGRWEISLMQRAIALVQGRQRGDYRDGVQVGRQLFASLPEGNRLKQRERDRWAMENQRDECFADMYVHPQEVDYTLDSLFELIDQSGLEFVGFSNPEVWQLDRLLAADPALLERARQLPQPDQYRLIELLDPEITHFEWFLARPPYPRWNWEDNAALLAAVPTRNPCMEGWPSQSIFDQNYQFVTLTPQEVDFLKACDHHNGSGSGQPPATVADLVAESGFTLQDVQQMQQRQLILLR
ncbi:class I SAM-dependent methyltransferase [Leptolyngbya sp. KIOST-1]|uniref:class I SAM-dependent methyltransferase n=1 Tax=Leptolyngbya sp. KIOST-1 TaxID=1229172 RepID=UPI00055C21AB|nr:class I SAM-dependent methyltransferase [Leptolyngbya sp. KIOST-1]